MVIHMPEKKCCELKTPGGATVSGCCAPCAWCCCACCCEPMMQPIQESAKKEVEKQLASEGESVLKRAITQALKDVVIQLDAPENETMEGRERGTSTIKIFPKAEYEASQRERAASAATGKKAEELTRSKSKFSAATKLEAGWTVPDAPTEAAKFSAPAEAAKAGETITFSDIFDDKGAPLQVTIVGGHLDCNKIPEIARKKKLPDAIFSQKPELVSIIVADGVTELGQRCFFNSRNLKSVVLPKGITEFGGNCFTTCEGLESIVLPEALEKVPMACFQDCKALKSVTVGPKLTTMGMLAFARCKALTSIDVPASVTIEDMCFDGCDTTVNRT